MEYLLVKREGMTCKDAGMVNIYRALIGLFIAVGVGMGCEQRKFERPPGTPLSQARAAAAKPAQAPELKKEEKIGEEPVFIYSYNPIGKRDPFKSYVAEMGGKSEETSLSALQKYSIDQLKVTGIIWGIANPKAIIEDPEKFGHVIEKGSFVGRNWGKVTRIGSNEVVIAEEYRDPLGKLIINEISMKLKPEEKAK